MALYFADRRRILVGVINPIIAAIFGKSNFTEIGFDIGDARISVGLVIDAVISFVVVAFILFLIVKAYNKWRGAAGRPRPRSPCSRRSATSCAPARRSEPFQCPDAPAATPRPRRRRARVLTACGAGRRGGSARRARHRAGRRRAAAGRRRARRSPPTKDQVDRATSPTTEPTSTTTRPRRAGTTTTSTSVPEFEPVGDVVDGNRLLVIGDSIMASTAQRYGGEMCRQLVPQGWAVEVDAETGQRVEFAREVLDARLRAGWDAVAIMLGNNYDHDPQAYAKVLDEVLDEIGDRPVLLYTVTHFRDEQAEVNYVISSVAREHDNVRIVDWAGHTEDAPELLGGDGLHLSDAGRQELVALTAYALGRAPAGQPRRVPAHPLHRRFGDPTERRLTGIQTTVGSGSAACHP